MRAAAALWQSEVAAVRAPKLGTFTCKSGERGVVAISFATDARCANGAASGECVTCFFDAAANRACASVSNAFASAVPAAQATSLASGDYLVRFGKTSKPGALRATLEVFKGGALVQSGLVTADDHGEPLADAHLQQLAVDEVAGRAFFVARAPPVTRPSLDEFLGGAGAAWAPDSVAHKDLGETLPGLVGTSIAHVPLRADNASTSATVATRLVVPAAACGSFAEAYPHVGYPCAVHGVGVIFAAFPAQVAHRGLVHCFAARPNAQFAVRIDATTGAPSAPTRIELGGSVKQLTYRRCGDAHRVVFFDFPSSLPVSRRPHLGCASLCVAELDDALAVVARRTVVDVVRACESAAAFPGLFPLYGAGDALVWLDDDTVIVGSARRSAHVLYAITVSSGAITLLTPMPGAWRFAALARVDGESGAPRVVAVHSETARPPRVLVQSASGSASEWVEVFDSRSRGEQRRAAGPSTTVAPLVTAPHAGDVIFVRSHAAAPAAAPQRLVLTAHGGPHSTDTNAFARGTWLLLCAGFDILSVNYRGSLGFGQDAVEALLGRIGEMDVEDMLAALQQARDAGWVGADARVCASGGSHSGFLVAHLLGLDGVDPRARFAAAVLRNPVTDVAAIASISDITDWAMAEAGVPPADAGTGDAAGSGAAARDIMTRCSPMLTASRVRTPVLVAIGAVDLRVPPPQGRGWAHAVRTNSHAPLVRVVEFAADNHAIDSPASEAELAILVLEFFSCHTRRLEDRAAQAVSH